MGDVSSSTPPSIRAATVERNTNETKIKASLALDVHPSIAPQVISVKTGIGFLDHVSLISNPNTLTEGSQRFG